MFKTVLRLASSPAGLSLVMSTQFAANTRGEIFYGLGPVHMIPGQGNSLTRGQLSSVHGLAPVTVHMSLSLPRGNFERQVTRCTTPGNPPYQGNFLHLNRTQKLPRGKSSVAHAHY